MSFTNEVDILILNAAQPSFISSIFTVTSSLLPSESVANDDGSGDGDDDSDDEVEEEVAIVVDVGRGTTLPVRMT